MKTKRREIASLHKLVPSTNSSQKELHIEGLRQNNLKNLTLSIPHNAITAVVGPSGSGKSTLAFDTLFAEGRWRFMESLSTYTRLFLERMDRPELDMIRNIRPAIAIEQKNPVRSSRSTVATATEIYDYMRVLFARAGTTHCPECDEPIIEATPARLADKIISEESGKRATIGFKISFSETPDKEARFKEIKKLLKKGFIRAIKDNDTLNLEEVALQVKFETLSHINIISDRIVIKGAGFARLSEALESTLDEGGGEAWISIEEAEGKFKKIALSNKFGCAKCDIILKRATPVLFSFNHPIGACPDCKGFGKLLTYSTDRVIPDVTLSLNEGAIEPWTKPSYRWWHEEMADNASECGLDMDKPFNKLTKKEHQIVFEGTSGFDGIDGFFDHLETKKYKLHIRVFLSRYKEQSLCEACSGTRLKENALSVRVGGLNIAELTRKTISEARDFISNLVFTPYEKDIAKEILKQLSNKLEFLDRTGLGYITLDRLTKTLSGGEAQRVTLANQLGSALSGVLYILDEPSVGLHARDVDKLIGQIKDLSARGNTVVLVEHDPSVIAASDHLLELGPGAGERGGRLVYSGKTERFLKGVRTLTSEYLCGKKKISVPHWRRTGRKDFITLKGATGNNLNGVNLKLPINTLTCITGVSGSGKSTLIMDTLYNALGERLGFRTDKPLPYKSLWGTGLIDGVKSINQEPIGRTPRSNPITYLGCFDDIRRFFAELPSSRNYGLNQGSFSFNVPGGRCEACKGQGVEKLEMYFLPDIYIPCAGCNGKRYKPQVLDVKFKGKNIYDLLNSTFEEVSSILPTTPNLARKFSIIKEVGLSYLKLGQPATTLSGGEAQRLKIARELTLGDSNNNLYILDEPTTGLHMDDIKNLLSVLGRLVDTGNTVIIIEHNLDCIKTADHIIDLGPEGGCGGGDIIAEGTPEEVAEVEASYTGRYLKEILTP